jgi:GNAT superfamily N-acetyltransferase
MAAIAIRLGDGALARQHGVNICRLYQAVFSATPFVWSDGDAESHQQMLTEMSSDRTFGVALAFDGTATVGFAYGHRLPVAHGWWRDFAVELPENFAAEWEGRTFALIDLAVAAGHRGRGVGGRLLRRLLGSRAEERAVLSVQPTALDTHRIYEHLGWQRIGQKGPIPGVSPAYWIIYALDL